VLKQVGFQTHNVSQLYNLARSELDSATRNFPAAT